MSRVVAHVAVAFACLVAIWVSSDPFVHFFSLLAVGAVGFLAGVPWLYWLFVTASDRGLRGISRSSFIAWLIVPVLVIVTGAVAVSGIPFDVRFRVSETQLTAFVEHHLGDAYMPTPGMVGLFKIEGATRVPGGARLYTGPAGLIDIGGLVYLPDGGRAQEWCDWSRPLGGGWSLCYEHF